VLKSIVQVADDEVRALWWSFAYFFTLLAGWYVLRPLRDASVAEGGVNRLPALMAYTLGAMLIVVPIYSWLVARVPRARLVPLVYRFFIVNLVGFYLAWRFGTARATTALVFYVWTSVYNLFVVSVFWSLMADLWSSDQGRRLFGFIAAGGSAGAIVGPLVTGLLVGPLGKANLILISAILLEGSAQCVGRLTHGRTVTRSAPAPVGGGALAGILNTLRSPYLAGIVAMTLLFSITSTVFYVVQQHLIADALKAEADRARFFANQELLVNIAAALLQAGVTGRIVNRMGIGVGLALTPLITIGGLAVVYFMPGLMLVTGLLIVRRVLHFAVDRPAKEVLFTQVAREDKYKAKSFIDTVVYRSGDAISAQLFPAFGALTLPVALPLAGAWLVVNLILARSFEARALAAKGVTS
jgi:AAA family ATP:ADP antiporter